MKTGGKFLWREGEKLYLKAARVQGDALPTGVNTLWLENPTAERIAAAHAAGLYSVACLGLEQALQAKFRGERSQWKRTTRKLVREIRNAPGLLAYDLGGPVSSTYRRWKGDRGVERAIAAAARAVKQWDQAHPITATAELSALRLQLPSLDFLTARLDAGTDLRPTLASLQTLAAERPLVIEHAPAPLSPELAEQRIRLTFQAGCAGITLDPGEIDPTLDDSPFPAEVTYPRISVVVCAYNGAETIVECLEGVRALDYPNFECIVVNDGSRDRTVELAGPRCDRLIDFERNRGLSAARNAGAEAATGEIVAYLDSDAYPDRDWLRYLALAFQGTKHAAIGGPNLNPPSDGPLSECISRAPGNPAVVMSDTELADHLPGCNLAVRRAFMLAIGGFDVAYPGAGDDVAFCWRVLKHGGTLGVAPGAMIWHHRRPTISAFLRQQRSYGRGDRRLAREWPERFNSLSHQVRVGPAPEHKGGLLRARIYHKVDQGSFWTHWFVLIPSTPEWPLIPIILALASSSAALRPFTGPALALASFAWLFQAHYLASRTFAPHFKPWQRWTVTFLFLAQPLARLRGRFSGGSTPWSSRRPEAFLLPRPRLLNVPKPGWMSRRDVHRMLEGMMRSRALPFVRGDQALGWDWQVEGGMFGGVRCLADITDELVTTRLWPYPGSLARYSLAVVAAAALPAWHAWPLLLLLALVIVGSALRQAGQAMALIVPVADGSRWPVSEWDRFSPPGHFFEIPWS